MKDALRQELLARRAALSAEERRRQSAAIVERLEHLPPVRRARVVLGYSALATEVDVGTLLEAAARRGVRILLPRVDGESLRLHDWTPGDELRRAPWGVREPAARAPTAEPEEVDIALVPGLGFDRTGHRLGFGRGHYDRLLAHVPRPLRVGVAFDIQVVDRLPAQEHDQPMGWLVTPAQTTFFPEST